VRVKGLPQILTIFMLFFVVAGYVNAQLVTTATISESQTFWKELDDPIHIGNGSNPWGEIPMPFTFVYDNVNVTRIYAYGNGFVSFNTYRNPDGAAIPKLYSFPLIVSWYAADLVTQGNLSYKVTGIAPFRVLTVQQTNARTFLDFSGASMDVQIKFFETSNNIQIIYGDGSGIGGGGINGWIYFSGNSSRYLNIQPREPSLPSIVHRSNVNPNTQTWLTSATRNFVFEGKTYTYSANPTLALVYPFAGDILAQGEVYEGDMRPYVRVNRADSQGDIGIRYKISGPLPVDNPLYQTIYTAVNEEDLDASELVVPDPQPIGTNIFVRMPHAKGIAGRLSDGALDLRGDIPGGEYEVEATLTLVNNPTYQQTIRNIVTISPLNDIAITRSESPMNFTRARYAIGQTTIPILLTVANQGKNPVTKFRVTYNITGPATSSNSILYELTEENALKFGETMNISFGNYTPPVTGDYKITFNVELLSAPSDDLPANNQFPRQGADDIVFRVVHEVEGEIVQIVEPTEPIYLYNPVNPAILLRNNGASDISEAVLRLTITKQGEQEPEYYQEMIVDQIWQGSLNSVVAYFEQEWIPQHLGTYNVKAELDVSLDLVLTNNVLEKTVNVQAGMSGNYTISQHPSRINNPRNFRHVIDAVTALYTRGVAAPVSFEMFNETYEVGSKIRLGQPALDFRTRIPGVSETNTIRFYPSPLIAQRGVVKIMLRSENGIGIHFGQADESNIVDASINKVNVTNKRNYANGSQYITFDGGNRKAISFELDTDNDFRAVLYLAQGASNITVKNCLITDVAPRYTCGLPTNYYDVVESKFVFEPNEDGVRDFTAGVLIRSTMPLERRFETNFFNLDTLSNMHNNIDANEITGFGYGVVSLGMSVLDVVNSQEFGLFYNKNNNIANNLITNVGRAGIYVGNEYESVIHGNRIYNVLGTCSQDAAGIIAGGDNKINRFPYHNIGLTISANEISDVYATKNAYGINFIQGGFRLDKQSRTYFFPNLPSEAKIYNNIVWGLKPTNANTNVYGISMMTQRATFNDDWADGQFAPELENFFIEDDVIAHNTIWLFEDDYVNMGVIAGLALSQYKNTTIRNNAIAVTDELINENSPAATAFLFYGAGSAIGGFDSDRNVFWYGNADATVARFIETNWDNMIIEAGYRNEFKYLDQWRPWTQSDWNSTYAPFINDLTFYLRDEQLQIGPNKLRVRRYPVPYNSVLNNRAETMELVMVDIDGNPRGEANEPHDIGAQEFNGGISARDLEVVALLAPSAYKATEGPYSNYEYIMTKSPVPIVARLRNNSSMVASGVKVTARAYRQTHLGTWQEEFTRTLDANYIQPGAFFDLEFTDFNFPFTPRTYGDFAVPAQPYNIPVAYRFMEANVTPLYRFVLEIENDEINSNNKIEKVIRFFLHRSNLSMLISTDNIVNINGGSTQNEIANRLNLDSLRRALLMFGWRVDLFREDAIIDYDIFDRTVWEPRSVNYPLYRTLFWVDGHDTKGEMVNTLNRYEKDDLIRYLNAGTVLNKKNLFVSSQDIVRNNMGENEEFINHLLRAEYETPGNPMNVDGNYDGKTVRGVNVGRDAIEEVKSTEFAGDDYPKVGLMKIYTSEDVELPGESSQAFRYNTYFTDDPDAGILAPESKRVAGVTTIALNFNIIHLGVEWRHWSSLESVLRYIIDYAERYDGNIIPIELLDFTAEAIGERVDLSWSTASEINSSYFDVERAKINETGKAQFNTIDKLSASGKTTHITHYGPVVDNNVKYGETYAYRLKMVDIDGEYEYSEERIVTLNGNTGLNWISEIMPNPSNDFAKINFEISETANVTAILYDNNGREIMTVLSNTLGAGTHSIRIEAANLASGSYKLAIRIGEETITRPITIVK